MYSSEEVVGGDLTSSLNCVDAGRAANVGGESVVLERLTENA